MCFTIDAIIFTKSSFQQVVVLEVLKLKQVKAKKASTWSFTITCFNRLLSNVKCLTTTKSNTFELSGK